ncbi:MAG TPA: hypothetical protein VMZ71_02905 [Gemmataceae bacterium]|nr:hypothetical protein [Gemmataceae bacterium]
MARPVHLFAAVLSLAVAGCGSGAADGPPDKEIHIRVEENTTDPGAVVEKISGFGVAAILYDRYRVAVRLGGGLVRPDSSLDVWLAMVRVEADEPMPDAVPIVLELESDTLPRRTVTVRAEEEGEFGAPREFGTFKVQRRPKGLLLVNFTNVYGIDWREGTTRFPNGGHTIRVRVGIDGKPPVALPRELHLRVEYLRGG